MEATWDRQNLGAFEPDKRPPIVLARVAFAVAVASAAVAVARPIVVGSGVDLSWSRIAAVALGVAGILASLAALYLVATRGLRGRALALAALGLAAAGPVVAIVYAASHDGTLRLDRIWHEYFDPTIFRAVVPDIAHAAANTMKASVIGMAIAIGVGLVVATFSLSPRRVVRLPAMAYVDVTRCVPLVLMAYMVAFGLAAIGLVLGVIAGVATTLAIIYSGYIAEIFRAGIQSLPRSQVDGARGLGMTRGGAMVSVVLPQAIRVVIPPLMNDFIALVKDSAVVFLVFGVTPQTRDMFTAASQDSSSTFSATPFTVAALGYLIILIPLTRLVGVAERRLRRGLA
jgi:polar amino acid transport system permease protein